MAVQHGGTVNICEAKTGFSRLINDVESGDEITISRNGRPVARLVPYRTSRPARTPGVLRGKISIADDFDDFSLLDVLVAQAIVEGFPLLTADRRLREYDVECL